MHSFFDCGVDLIDAGLHGVALEDQVRPVGYETLDLGVCQDVADFAHD